LAYHGLGRHEEAIAAFKKALVSDPDFPPAHTYLTSIYGELGRPDEARAQAAEVLRLDPGFSLAALVQREVLKDPAVMERLVGGLRKAGLPE
jgi:adenylate cyclase